MKQAKFNWDKVYIFVEMLTLEIICHILKIK